MRRDTHFDRVEVKTLALSDGNEVGVSFSRLMEEVRIATDNDLDVRFGSPAHLAGVSLPLKSTDGWVALPIRVVSIYVKATNGAPPSANVRIIGFTNEAA